MSDTQKIIAGRTRQMYAWFPVVAGVDASNNPQLLKVDSSGRLITAAEITAELATLEGKVDSTNTLLGGTLTVKGGGTRKATVLTRPADTTAYAAADCVGGLFSLASVTPTAGRPVILGSVLMIYGVASDPGGNFGAFRLHFFQTTKTLADNAAMSGVLAATLADADDYLGYVDLAEPSDVGGCLVTQEDAINRQITPATTSLYCALETAGDWTPGASEKILIAAEFAYL